MTKRKRCHDHDRALQIQLLTLGVILLAIACILLGLDLSAHMTHVVQHVQNTPVNIKVSQSCVNNGDGIPTVYGKG